MGAHYQNGIAESHIKSLTLTSRTLLFHAQCHWPKAITIMLWHFALKASEEIHNNLNFDGEGHSPMSKISMVDSPIRPRNVLVTQGLV